MNKFSCMKCYQVACSVTIFNHCVIGTKYSRCNIHILHDNYKTKCILISFKQFYRCYWSHGLMRVKKFLSYVAQEYS